MAVREEEDCTLLESACMHVSITWDELWHSAAIVRHGHRAAFGGVAS